MRIFGTEYSSYVIMKWSNIFRPLGTPKKEIPLAIPVALAAGSAISSLFGGSASARAARRARRAAELERTTLEAERRRRLNEDYADTAAGQNLLRIGRREADKMWKREAGMSAVTGSTDAASQMAKDRGAQMMGDIVAGIAGQDTARKDQIDANYQARLTAVNRDLAEADQAKAEAIASAASGASSAFAQGALTTFGGTQLGQQWLGSPGGGGVVGTLNKMGKDSPLFLNKDLWFEILK